MARKLGILDEMAYKKLRIRIEFEELKESRPDVTVEVIMTQLADREHLGIETIRDYCYPRKSRNADDPEEITSINLKLKRRSRARRRSS